MSALLTELKYFHFFVLVAVTCGHNFSDLGPTRYDLIHYLLDERRYDPSLPPDYYTENITTVSVELSIYDLNSESDMAMELECTLYLRMNWTDKRLDYTANKTTFDTIDLGDAIVDKVWVPDLYFHHARRAEMHGLFTKNQLLYIYRNGSVLYSSRFNIKWHCPMDFTRYPFDKPRCPIVIQSYSLNKDNLILKWNKGDAVRSDTVFNLEVDNTSLIHSYHSPYDKPVGNFSTLEAKLILIRPTLSLTYIYIVPAIVFFGESLISFLLGDQVATRIGIPCGALLQLILQWTGIPNKLPASSEPRKLDIWMLANLFSVAIVIVVNAVICHFVITKKHEQEEKEKEKKEKKEKEEKEKKKAEEIKNRVGDETEQPCRGATKTEIEELSKQSRPTTHLESKQRLLYKSNKRGTGESMPLLLDEQKIYRTCEPEERDITEQTIPKEFRTATFDENRTSVQQSIECVEMRSLENSNENDVDTDTNDLQENELKEDFLQLLKDNKDITTSTTWDVAKETLNDDPRYIRACIGDKASSWYSEYIDKKKKKDFLELLHEKARTIKTWRRASMMIDHDLRYKVVDTDEVRQQWFAEYRKCLWGFDLFYLFKTKLKKILKKIQKKGLKKLQQNISSDITVNSISFTFLSLMYGIFAIYFYVDWSKNEYYNVNLLK